VTIHARPLPAPDAAEVAALLARAAEGGRIADEEALRLAGFADLDALMRSAAAIRDRGRGDTVSYSRKVFIPLTHLCRDACHYCTFARPPRRGERAFLAPDEVLAIAEAGRRAGCREALFTLGDKPELRYRAARDALAGLGHRTTLSYLGEMARRVFEETGLLPHLNPGVMDEAEIGRLRPFAASMGLMLETAAGRLAERGGPHFGSPDKLPAARLATIAAAGRAAVPFTSGILIGIGETRRERIEALLALRALHEAHGHIQEIIVQNFRAKPGTRMAGHAEPDFADHLWTVAVARIVFGSEMTIQVPPNLSAGGLAELVAAGIDDWGGVSPVTIDHVNPEAPWPEIEALAAETARAGKVLVQRLAVNGRFLAAPDRWLAPPLRQAALAATDGDGFVRDGSWAPGLAVPPDGRPLRGTPAAIATGPRTAIAAALAAAEAGRELSEEAIAALLRARDEDFHRICTAADALRQAASGEVIRYVVTRNINYTNICSYRCQFCAFSKGKLSENLRGRPYDLDLAEIAARVQQAWARGATEVCMQGGIHPAYTGRHYLEVLATARAAAPGIHVHAFSPLEVFQGAATLGMPLAEFLAELRAAGLGSLPGTAAEILDDAVRQVICPDKVTTEEWLTVMRTAHRVGLRSTATIMFGHVERPEHSARHLLRLRRLQAETGGFTELVPLPFVPMETPIFLKGRSRRGPTLREAVLMHAVARLALHPLIPNIQVSWVKMGAEGARLCLAAGANDLGGTLMDESISRAAGAAHGQEMTPGALEAIITALGRTPRQRTTLYDDAPAERVAAAAAGYASRETGGETAGPGTAG
jgi:FO synthase